MNPSDQSSNSGGGHATWRYAILGLVIFAPLFWLLNLEPISQDTAYHAFVDSGEILSVPNFLNIVTNLPFLLIGFAGVRYCLRSRIANRGSWSAMFIGVWLVGFGSAYYHLSPSNDTLVWDRLPMALGFMGLFSALVGEYLGKRYGQLLLYPAIALGLATVFYWHVADDLRPYIWIQFVPLISIPVFVALFRSGRSHQWLLLVALGWYVLAKVAEFYDAEIYHGAQEWISGHSLKHLLASAGVYSILVMLKKRKLLPTGIIVK